MFLGRLRVATGRAAIIHAPQAGIKEGHGKAVGYLTLFSEIGLVLFVTTLGGALAGRWLDQQLGTYPIILVGGFILGVVLGAVADWRLVDRFLKDTKES